MINIRPATAADQELLGRFGGALMRQHHAAEVFFRYRRIEDEGECFVDDEMEDPRWKLLPDLETLTGGSGST